MSERLFLVAGLLAAPLFLAAVLVGSYLVPGYSQAANAVSELTGQGVAGRAVTATLFVVSAVMTALFGAGLWWRYAGRDRWLQIAGAAVTVIGLIAMALSSVFPQDPIGAVLTWPGLMHLVLVGLSGFLLMGVIALVGWRLPGDHGGGRMFRLWSLLVILAMALGGVGSMLAIDRGWPLMGIFERVTLTAYQTWLFVLAALLLRDAVAERGRR